MVQRQKVIRTNARTYTRVSDPVTKNIFHVVLNNCLNFESLLVFLPLHPS
jgi:hypothetical protein